MKPCQACRPAGDLGPEYQVGGRDVRDVIASWPAHASGIEQAALGVGDPRRPRACYFQAVDSVQIKILFWRKRHCLRCSVVHCRAYRHDVTVGTGDAVVRRILGPRGSSATLKVSTSVVGRLWKPNRSTLVTLGPSLPSGVTCTTAVARARSEVGIATIRRDHVVGADRQRG